MLSLTDDPALSRSPSGDGVLVDELESLRATGAGMGADPIAAGAGDLLAALERAGVDGARVAQVATLIELASSLDGVASVKGGAGVGSIVRVADRAGRTSEYELIGRPEPEGTPQKVTLSSPVGEALLGARPGDHVRITLPNGRRRRVRVTNVQPRTLGSLRAALSQGSAEA